MKKLIAIALVLILFSIPVMAQEEPVQDEKLLQSFLEYKFKLGQELQASAQLHAQVIRLRKQVVGLKAQIKTLIAEKAKNVLKAEPEKKE